MMLRSKLAVAVLVLILSPLGASELVAQSRLTASNFTLGDAFGDAVAISGDTLVIGAPAEDSAATGVDGDQSSNAKVNSGAAYVFVRSGSTWVQQAYLKASNTDPMDAFGASVAISGDTIVVGAPHEDSPATGIDGDQGNFPFGDPFLFDKGAAYVFVRNGTTWSQEAYLKPSWNGLRFGIAVSVSGDTVVVGSDGEDGSATGINGDDHLTDTPNAGAAFVFVREGGRWSQQAYVKASNTGEDDFFGNAVALSGDTLVVGAFHEQSAATGIDGDQGDDSAPFAGAAYVYQRTGSTWVQEAYLKASNNEAGDRFGSAVSVSGDTIVVGSRNEDGSAPGVDGDGSDDSRSSSGAAYVFARDGGVWSQQAYLKSSNPDVGDQCGRAVAASGDLVLVGGYLEDSGASGVNGSQGNSPVGDFGAAYLFTRAGTSWSQHSYLKSSLPLPNELFGQSTALDVDTAVVGGLGMDAAYVLDLQDLTPGPWQGLGSSLPGVSGHPHLVGTGALAGGDPLNLMLAHAKPGGSVALIFGFSALNVPFKGGTLVPMPDLIVTGLFANGSGALSLSTTWPAALPAGLQFWIQDWIVDAAGPAGFAASNAVKATSQ